MKLAVTYFCILAIAKLLHIYCILMHILDCIFVNTVLLHQHECFGTAYCTFIAYWCLFWIAYLGPGILSHCMFVNILERQHAWAWRAAIWPWTWKWAKWTNGQTFLDKDKKKIIHLCLLHSHGLGLWFDSAAWFCYVPLQRSKPVSTVTTGVKSSPRWGLFPLVLPFTRLLVIN